MPNINPREHQEFFSYGNSMKLLTPLVFDEHYPTSLTVFTKKIADDEEIAKISISVEGPLIIKDVASGNETRNLTRTLTIPGNDSFHVQSPVEYKYPSGLEGDCCAQASICVKKIETINGNEVQSDSRPVDVMIRRRFLNAFKALWLSLENAAKFLITSVVFTYLSTIIGPYVGVRFGNNYVALAVTFIFFALIISLLWSWYTVDRKINERLENNPDWLKLKGEIND
jgi:hypothetical protein